MRNKLYYECLNCGFKMPRPNTLVNPALILRATCPACGMDGPMRFLDGVEAVKPYEKRAKKLSERIFAKPD